ncbi:MAG: acyl-CoA dehydrogenase C-terminal domain-containing protein, partial [Gammaproteobacteria bacterium]|nr:acyl-CoA dehydrogenase C-terminal domain-containing protein [Gammaproteobacteria bacterium]
GTTGIQAADFVGRKILRDGGKALKALLADMSATVAELERHGTRLRAVRAALEEGVASLATAARWLATNYQKSPGVPGAVSNPLLMLTGTVLGGWQLARAAAAACDMLQGEPADAAFLEAKIMTAEFYAGQIMPQAICYRRMIEAGCDALLGLREEQF